MNGCRAGKGKPIEGDETTVSWRYESAPARCGEVFATFLQYQMSQRWRLCEVQTSASPFAYAPAAARSCIRVDTGRNFFESWSLEAAIKRNRQMNTKRQSRRKWWIVVPLPPRGCLGGLVIPALVVSGQWHGLNYLGLQILVKISWGIPILRGPRPGL
jgi:hypothetical protein